MALAAVATHLIWAAAGRPGTAMGTRKVRQVPLVRRDPLPCFWCGYISDLGTAVRVSALAWDHFTNWDLARRPDSGWICAACLYAFKDRALRFGHWVASGAGLVRIPRHDPAIRRFLLEPPEPPFAIGLCRPGESKHTAIRARVNHDRERFWVQYGEEPVWLHRAALARWAGALAALAAAGAKPGEVRHGRYRRAIRQALADRWPETEGALREARQSGAGVFALLLTAFLESGGMG